MIAIVWNSRAGSAANLELAELRSLGPVYELGDRAVREIVREARDAGATTIVAAGGDGTVSSVAAELVGTGLTLGVLPLGTSNSFAAALGIPTELADAVALIADGAGRMLDVAIVENASGRRTMTLHCMIGFHADTIKETSTDAKRRWGVLAYAASALRRLANLEQFRLELRAGRDLIKCRAIGVAAANLAPPKSVLAHGPSHLLGDDGQLDVTIVAADSIAEALATGVHLYRSARKDEPATRDNVGSFAAAQLAITCEPAQHVLVDGEPFGMTPVTIETLPRALAVIAPPADTEGPPIEAPLEGLPELEIART